MKASQSILNNNRKEDKTPEKIKDSVEPVEQQPYTIHKQGTAELKLTSLNESASKKKRPFDYNENEEEGKIFSLKELDPE